MKRGYNRQDVANSLMAPTGIDRLLQYEGTIANRGGVLPFVRRVVPDIGGDDISEFEGPPELGLPALLYDPLSSMAKVGAMATGDMKINPDIITNAAVDAPLMGSLLSGATGAVPKGAVLGANVFHGGPHRFAPEPDFPFGRPRLDYVGTGEGNQAYGFGFYSAEAPGVAKSYKDTLGGSAGVSVGGPKIGGAWRGDQSAQAIFSSAVASEGSVDAAVKSLRKNIKEMEDGTSVYKDYVKVGAIDQNRFDDMLGQFKDALKWHDASADSITYVPAGGTLYKLDIPDADIAKYLDYDKPLSEQPKRILQKIEPMIRNARGYDPSTATESNLSRIISASGDLRPEITGEMFYRGLAKDLGGDQAASEALRKAGIPGLKYFDQDSRAGGEGTRNYVTWDQDVLDRSKMLERDGQDLAKALMEVEP